MPPDPQLQRLRALLAERSVRRGDFVLASGRRSTFYVDARLTTMAGEGLDLIGRIGLARIQARGWSAAAVGGLTLGADPVAYAIAHAARLQGVVLDAFTVRKAAKTHGTGKRIEGCFKSGSDVIVVEDVITTGASAREAIDVIVSEGGRVVGVLAVVDREEGGRAMIEQTGVPIETLVLASEILKE